MLRRITELWPNLLRGQGDPGAGDDHLQEEEDEVDRATDE